MYMLVHKCGWLFGLKITKKQALMIWNYNPTTESPTVDIRACLKPPIGNKQNLNPWIFNLFQLLGKNLIFLGEGYFCCWLCMKYWSGTLGSLTGSGNEIHFQIYAALQAFKQNWKHHSNFLFSQYKASHGIQLFCNTGVLIKKKGNVIQEKDKQSVWKQ